MECREEIVDLRIPDPESFKEGQRLAKVLFELNHTVPMSEEYQVLLKELFGENLGEHSMVMAPLQGACLNNIRIGKHVLINTNLLAMARGGITIEDDVQIASNVQILTNNHDPYERMVIPCRPVLIQKGAWIGAGATILPGVSIGKHAIVGAASVVTKDVPDYAVAVGNPARVVKMLEKERFAD